MKLLSGLIIESLWPLVVKEGVVYRTPDDEKGAEFTVKESDEFWIRIETTGNSLITIQRDSFVAAIRYLMLHGHLGEDKSSPIGASIDNPGPLDLETRGPSGGTMVIPYILPLLANLGVVGIDGSRPNKTWLNL